ncbi:MAG: hypothetical protein WC648_04695 [Candidatus Paceibacterota bacterium]|jgi:hypothetical protein
MMTFDDLIGRIWSMMKHKARCAIECITGLPGMCRNFMRYMRQGFSFKASFWMAVNRL